MTRRSVVALVLATAASAASVPGFAQQKAEPVPNPQVVIQRACDAAGGLEAFRTLGILRLEVHREEVTQEGKTADSLTGLFVQAPGPTPGRLEYPGQKVVAGDDGSGGWALIDGHPDERPGTERMVKRMLDSDLFPVLLPFSLTWDGVEVKEVERATVDGHPVWRLKVTLAQTFFHTPQIATNWSIDVDRDSYEVRRADSPYTDLGKGVTADGMRFRWNNPVQLRGVTFRAEQRVTGLDEFGREKSHSRIDHITFALLPEGDATKLFANPIPPEMRPKYGPQPVPLPTGKP